MARWWLLAAACACAWGQEDGRIWEGVYTSAQADRGKAAYNTSCVNCHVADLNGSVRAPSLKGTRFMAAWQNTTVNNLFRKIRDSMPATYPDTVAEDVKLDIIAYLLQQNGFPAGNAELKVDPDELEKIQIAAKGASGVPNFAVVRVVGCLEHGPGKSWVLSSASEPAIVKDNATGSDATGGGRVLLISAAGFDPAPNAGHKIEAQGLLYRESMETRINVTALRPLAPACP